MSTPEGRTKALIDALLLKHKIYPAKDAGAFPRDASGWYFKPVQSMMSVKGIPDYIGNYRCQFFGIEAKAPGKKPTGFQDLQIQAIRTAGSPCFVVDGEESLRQFEEWLNI